MKIIFAGTSGFAVPCLKALIKTGEHTLLGVITQPDQRSGRGLKKTVSPVKETALAYHLTLFQPVSINEPAFQKTLRELAPEIMVVAAYGQKLSKEIISLPGYGCINIHPSLLPKYRGSAPINYALWNGEPETGVTIFKIVEKMDAGPMLAQERLAIEPEETAGQLEMRLAKLGAELLIKTLTRLERGEVKLIPQDESPAFGEAPAPKGEARHRRRLRRQVTYARHLKKSDGLIDWTQRALRIKNLVRAMQPWPGAHTFYHSATRGSLKLDLIKVEVRDTGSDRVGSPTDSSRLSPAEGEARPYGRRFTESQPGIVEEITNDAIIVRTGQAALGIKELKPAGHKTMTARDFVNGYRIKKGDRFEVE